MCVLQCCTFCVYFNAVHFVCISMLYIFTLNTNSMNVHGTAQNLLLKYMWTSNICLKKQENKIWNRCLFCPGFPENPPSFSSSFSVRIRYLFLQVSPSESAIFFFKFLRQNPIILTIFRAVCLYITSFKVYTIFL